jgi:DNA invertase Pin-like site-specific DNA recombinase
MRIGYSYLRFSSPAQADGDSIHRQTEATRAWCERHGVHLDTSTTIKDEGRSAFRGKHRFQGHLRRFLDQVQAGDIPRGSVLIIENLDRLSRENPWDALGVLSDLLKAGISVVTLSPSEMVYERSKDLTPLLLAVVEFTRAHSESASKSDRLTAIWDEKKRQARQEGGLVTRRLPGWLRPSEGKRTKNVLYSRADNVRVIPERVAVVRRIFDLAAHRGYGLARIVATFNAEGVPFFEQGGKRKLPGWSKAYLHNILTGRTVLGEYQPLRAGKPDGPPLPDYYPRVIDDATWHRAQAALQRRKESRGRTGKKVASLFTGLLWDALTRSRMLIGWQTRGPKGKRVRRHVLVNAKSMETGHDSVSFPYCVFQEAVLGLLREINPADVLGRPPDSEANALADERAALEARQRDIEGQLTDTDKPAPALVRAMQTLEAKRQDVLRREVAARQREANPQGAAWSKAQSLLDLAYDEDNRLRLRDLLPTIIERIWVLVVPSPLQRRPTQPTKTHRKDGTMKPRPAGSHRFALVQINFAEGARRFYLTHYQAAGRGRPGGRKTTTFRLDAAGVAPEFDLADDADVASARDHLLGLQPKNLTNGMPEYGTA